LGINLEVFQQNDGGDPMGCWAYWDDINDGGSTLSRLYWNVGGTTTGARSRRNVICQNASTPTPAPTPTLEPAPTCTDCGYVPNANVGWTGKETVIFVGTATGAGQKCCDECKAKASENPPCAAWVYIHDGHCYQKYDTGIPVTMATGPDSSGSDAGILEPAPTCTDCGYVPNANVGWTGKETVTFVGTALGAGQKCCDECKAKASENPPCAAWVYIHDGHCYQKYDTGIPVTMVSGPDSSGSDAGILEPAPACTDCGYVPNANVGWTGKETVTFVGTETGAGQKCCDECKAKAGENPPCAAWVYIHDGHCYQKYDTGLPVTMTDPDSSGSDAGILETMSE
jgi:hypothetical protein